VRCKKAKRLLPLFVGGDLSREKSSAVRTHLKKCDTCQQEYQSYVLCLDKTKEWLSQEKKDFQDQEWQSAIRRSIEERPARLSPLIPWPFKKSWAYTLMAVLIVVITLFVVRPFRNGFRQETGMSAVSEAPSRILLEEARQKVVSMTLVSRETGLKIAWFFNKDFDFKEEK